MLRRCFLLARLRYAAFAATDLATSWVDPFTRLFRLLDDLDAGAVAGFAFHFCAGQTVSLSCLGWATEMTLGQNPGGPCRVIEI